MIICECEVSMPGSVTAARIDAAEAHTTVISHTPAVTGWALRYFGPWWNAVNMPLTDDRGGTGDGAVVVAEVDLAVSLNSLTRRPAAHVRRSATPGRRFSSLEATTGLCARFPRRMS